MRDLIYDVIKAYCASRLVEHQLHSVSLTSSNPAVREAQCCNMGKTTQLMPLVPSTSVSFRKI